MINKCSRNKNTGFTYYTSVGWSTSVSFFMGWGVHDSLFTNPYKVACKLGLVFTPSVTLGIPKSGKKMSKMFTNHSH